MTPNRRGARSRAAVLDAAEEVMAAAGYDGATVAGIVAGSGIPQSSIYHYFGSKTGVLLAVMQRGADSFFSALPMPEEPVGEGVAHWLIVAATTARTLEEHPDFLRLLVALTAQPPLTDRARVREAVSRVRGEARRRLRAQIALAFDLDREGERAGDLADFALATIDGAFIAWAGDEGVDLEQILAMLGPSLAALSGRPIEPAADDAAG